MQISTQNIFLMMPHETETWKWGILIARCPVHQCIFHGVVLKTVRMLLSGSWRRDQQGAQAGAAGFTGTPNAPKAWDFYPIFGLSQKVLASPIWLFFFYIRENKKSFEEVGYLSTSSLTNTVHSSTNGNIAYANKRAPNCILTDFEYVILLSILLPCHKEANIFH